MYTFSVVIPSIGRPTLKRTLESIRTQRISQDDEIRVINDNPPHNDWGAWARTRGMHLSGGDFLLFMDDDDCYVPGAFEIIRKKVEINPDSVHIFRMKRHEPFNDVIWTRKDLSAPGQVCSQTIVVPNRKECLGEWTTRYEGDFDFLKSTLEKLGTEPIWCEDIICEAFLFDWQKK